MPEAASSIVYWLDAFSCTAVRKRRQTWNHGVINSVIAVGICTHEATSEQITIAKL